MRDGRTDGRTDRHTHTDRKEGRKVGRQTDRLEGMPAGRLIDRKASRQKDINISQSIQRGFLCKKRAQSHKKLLRHQ